MMPTRRRVLVLTQLYAPEPNFITADVAEALARDSDVVVVTAHPNYPFGQFYAGTRFTKIEKSIENGVVVWRVPFFADHSLSTVRRAVSYLSFAVMAGLVAPFVAGKPDIVWVYHGPFTTGLAALFFKVVYRSRLVLTSADLWPESFMAAGVVRSRLVMRLAAAYDRVLSRACDIIICPTRGTLQRFQDYGISVGRLVMIPLWVRGSREHASVEARATSPRLDIVYAGNLGPAQRIDTVILAAAALKEGGVSVHFDIYGTGACETQLRKLAADRGATNVSFHGRVSAAEAFSSSARSLAQIICLQPSPLFSSTVPSKIFSAFEAASPILFGLQGEAAELTAASGGGIAYSADDPNTLVTAVKQLLSLTAGERDDMRGRLKEYFSANFDPPLLISRYTEILKSPSLSHQAGLRKELTKECQTLEY